MALFFPQFALKGLGAGDVKLMGALGAWLGTSLVVGVAFYTTLAGGVLALGLIAKHRYAGQAARNIILFHALARRRTETLTSLTLETSAGPKLPYALPIAAGLSLTFWLW